MKTDLSTFQTRSKALKHFTGVLSEYLYIIHTTIYDLAATPVYTPFRIAVGSRGMMSGSCKEWMEVAGWSVERSLPWVESFMGVDSPCLTAEIASLRSQ